MCFNGNMKSLYVLLISHFFFCNIFGQYQNILNDYIITKENDTVFGLVYQLNSEKQIKFSIEGKTKKISVSELNGYKKGIKNYCVKRPGSHPVFVEIVENGFVSLYKHQLDFFLLEKNDSLIKIENFTLNKTYLPNKSRLISCFSDYPELTLAIKKNCFNFIDLPNLVKQYNQYKTNGTNNLQSDMPRGFVPGIIYKTNLDTLTGFLNTNYTDNIEYIDYLGNKSIINSSELDFFL